MSTVFKIGSSQQKIYLVLFIRTWILFTIKQKHNKSAKTMGKKKKQKEFYSEKSWQIAKNLR